VKNPFKSVVISCVPLLKAVLCSDCECISESRNEECGVCGGRSLVHLGRLLGSARENEAEINCGRPGSGGNAELTRLRSSWLGQLPALRG